MAGAEHHVNLHTHGDQISRAYEQVVDASSSTNWALFCYDKNTVDLKVQATGDGGLEELQEEFEGGKIQYAFVKVTDPNSQLPKFVFISWCGDGVPVTKKALITLHLPDVQKRLRGYHVEISARSEDDVDPKLILKKVRDTGAKYSHQQKDLHVRKDIPTDREPPAPVGTNYQRPDIVRASAAPAPPAEPVGTRYEKPAILGRSAEAAKAFSASNSSPNVPAVSSATALRQQREQQEKELMERERQAQKERESASASSKPSPTPPMRASKVSPRSSAAPTVQRADNVGVSPAMQLRMERERQDRELMEREKELESRRSNDELERQAAEQQEAERLKAQSESFQRERQNSQAAQVTEQRQQRAAAELKRQQQEEEDRRTTQQAMLEAKDAEEKEKQRQHEFQEKQRQHELEQEQQRQRAAAEEAERLAQQQLEEEELAARQVDEQRQLDSQREAVKPQFTTQPSARALYDYEPQEANELALVEGDVVVDIVQLDPGWWQGSIKPQDGSPSRHGLFPANYVELMESGDAVSQVKQEQTAAGSFSARVLYQYDAGETNEISLFEGEIVTEIMAVTDDWWSGTNSSGVAGLFPANYVERIA